MSEKSKIKIIEFKSLTKKFGDFTAVKDVNLEIFKGEIVGFLGPNGAGKSTTMKMMANLIKPNAGEIWIRHNGGDLEKLSNKTRDYLLDNIGFLIENPAFYDSSTPRSVLSYFAKMKGYPRSMVKNRVEEVVAMVGLTDWIDKKIGTFSKGMRQKIGIISAIVHDPEIVVLDEPYTGLDPKARKEVRDFILQLKDSGKTIFLSSHLLYEVSEVADKVAMISKGKIIAFDTLDNLEAMAKKSVINIELLDSMNEEDGISKIKQSIAKNDSLSEKLNSISYNHDMKRYELIFDGDPENQFKILDALIKGGVKVIDYSVPKAGLLEDLYLNFMSESKTTDKVEA